MKRTESLRSLAAPLLFAAFIGSPVILGAQKSAEIDRDVDAAIKTLSADSAIAGEILKIAKGVLVFPNVKKAGFLVGGQYGEGALREAGKTVGYYSTSAASFGLQAGAQSFGYAMFFMTTDALEYLKKSSGWEVGAGPSFVVVDEGAARSLTTTTLKEDVYVFFFSQKGLMGGVGLQGSKITPIDPDK
jgi:lipid-binding SYLF domain-containing protein